MMDFSKDFEGELREKIKQNKWGRWKYNPDNHCLEIVKKHGSMRSYEVDLDRCDTSARLLDWIYQVKHKSWISPDDIADLVYAVDDIFHTVQSLICSQGVDLEFNPQKYLNEKIDPLFKQKSSIGKRSKARPGTRRS